ncbi:MAG: hypothetical protein LBJ69_00300 [Holosporales bacterium]|nr:hypothetical protein [Holosporales bacterium]
MFVADLRGVISEVISGRIENLLRPHIEHQQLIWDLKEWAQVPDWLIEMIMIALNSRQLTTERCSKGLRELQKYHINNEPRWMLYAEVNINGTSLDRMICISKTDWELAYMIGYMLSSSGGPNTVEPTQMKYYIAHCLSSAYTIYVGAVNDTRQNLPDPDPAATAAFNVQTAYTGQTDPPTSIAATVPAMYAHVKQGKSNGAFLKIDVLPES